MPRDVPFVHLSMSPPNSPAPSLVKHSPSPQLFTARLPGWFTWSLVLNVTSSTSAKPPLNFTLVSLTPNQTLNSRRKNYPSSITSTLLATPSTIYLSWASNVFTLRKNTLSDIANHTGLPNFALWDHMALTLTHSFCSHYLASDCPFLDSSVFIYTAPSFLF